MSRIKEFWSHSWHGRVPSKIFLLLMLLGLGVLYFIILFWVLVSSYSYLYLKSIYFFFQGLLQSLG